MHRAYRRIAVIALVAVYLLIGVGSSVRASGAGMGCPDWPKCFGRWIPPTHVSQLPDNYQEIYAEHGYADEPFNAVKTWTEYVNRLIGVIVGLLVVVAAGFSLRLWQADVFVPLANITAVLLTGFAGWLGKIVVEQNLNPITVTLHMTTALLIIAMLHWAIARAGRPELPNLDRGQLRPVIILAAVCMALSIAQIVMGVQVREGVDAAFFALGEEARAQWIHETGIVFYIHRTFSLVVLAANAVLAYGVWTRAREAAPARRACIVALAIIAGEIITGATLYYGGFPAAVQPPHLVLATILFGAQLTILLTLRYSALKMTLQSPSPSP